MDITVLPVYDGNMYFAMAYDCVAYVSSSEIAKLLNLDVDEYNEILINKVVKHKQYRILKSNDLISSQDLTFDPLETCKEIYINRFKEAFAAQLMVLKLTGEKKW